MIWPHLVSMIFHEHLAAEFAPENGPFHAPKRKVDLPVPSIFRCELAVSFREGYIYDISRMTFFGSGHPTTNRP